MSNKSQPPIQIENGVLYTDGETWTAASEDGEWLPGLYADEFVNYVRDTPWAFPRITSWGFRVGRWTRNITRKTDSVDTPGRGGIRRRYR